MLIKLFKRGAISENSVKLLFHFAFAVIVIVIVSGIVLHYFKGKISSEDLESAIYANIVEKCLSKELNGRIYLGIIEEGKQEEFEDCFYISNNELYKSIVAINATLYVDNRPKWSVYFNKDKYKAWAKIESDMSLFSRYLIEKNVVYDNDSVQKNAKLLIDIVYPN